MPFADIRLPIKKLQVSLVLVEWQYSTYNYFVLQAIIDPNYKIPFPEQGHDPQLVDTIQR